MMVSGLLMFVAMATIAEATQVTIDTSKVIHVTDDHFISFNLDSGFFNDSQRWTHFNNTDLRLGMMLAVFSPAILRVGGSGADWTVFNTDLKVLNKTSLKPPQPVQVFTADDWSRLNWLVRGTGLRLLFDLNLQLRFGDQWDPTNAIELLSTSSQMQMGESVDLELGNEPNAFGGHRGQQVLSADQIARDFVLLREVMRNYPWFTMESRIVGPDVIGTDGDAAKIIHSVADIAGKSIDALTFHHYYFRGDTAKVQDYLNPKYFDDLERNIKNVRNIIKNTSNPDLPYWIGETADAWHSGTANVSNRFVSGFLWLDKLGLSASLGVGVVMRQTFFGGNYALVTSTYDPTPDYWLSLMFFRYVGHKVLSVTAATNRPLTTRVYAHCTNLNYRFPKPYPVGSVTVYALNMANVSDTIKLTGSLAKQDMDIYLLTAGDSNGILSTLVKVNGKVIKISGYHEMPFVIDPVKSHTAQGLNLPPYSFAFFVLPNAGVKVCT